MTKAIRKKRLKFIETKNMLGYIKDNNWQKVKKELEKCDLVCFNCHMEIHEELNKL